MYLLNQNGQNIQTAKINNFDIKNFTVEFDIKPVTFVSSQGLYRVLLVGGKGWRWVTILADESGKFGLTINNDGVISHFRYSDTAIPVGVFSTITLRYDYGATTLSVDGNEILYTAFPPLESSLTDYSFTTTNFGNDRVLDGCIRNLTVSQTPTDNIVFTGGFE